MVFPPAARGLLPALLLWAAPALAQEDAAAACLDRAHGPEAQVTACSVALDGATDPARRGDLLAERSRAHRLLGDLAASRSDIEAALASAPTDADPLIDQAYLLQVEGDIEGAVATMARAAELEPDYPRALIAYMDVLPEVGENERCLEIGARALELAPDSSLAWSIRGRCLAELGRYEEALADYDKAAGMGLDTAVLHDNRAIALWNLDRNEESLAAAQRAVELDPLHESARLSAIDALLDLGRPDEAVQAYRDALAAGVEDTMGLANAAAWGLYVTGHADKALPIIEEWLAAHPDLAPEQAWELDTYGHVLAALGRTEDAVSTFLRAVELGGPEWSGQYAERLAAQGYPGGADLRAGLEACVAAGSACRLSD